MAETSKKKLHDDPKLKEAREHFRSARKSMHKHWEKWLPEGFVESRRAARKDMLLGIRSILDYAIEKTDEKED
jgi:hypothetical protein